LPRLDQRFHDAVALLQQCLRRVILTAWAIGIICRKIGRDAH